MQRLFLFFYQFRAFIFFVLLELLSVWLIVKNNRYQSAAFFNSTNKYAAKAMGASNAVVEYLNLKKVNNDLAQENARLNYLYTQLQQLQSDSVSGGYGLDSAVAGRFQFKVAKVINNSTSKFNNYLTLDKGTADGIRPRMGVISPEGVVGRVLYCSEHFSTVASVLHLKMQFSVKFKKSGEIGSARWSGYDAREIDLIDVPPHINLQKGDTIITSSYNPFYPEGIMVGTIKDFSQQSGNSGFYENVDVALSTDFYKLSYVYVVSNKLIAEQDSLEQHTENTVVPD